MNPLRTYSEILELIDDFDPKKYAKTRNHLRGQVSLLSPYLARGVVSLPVVRDRILLRHTPEDAEKFLQELAWREYFQKVYYAKGKGIFSDLRFTRTDWQHDDVVSVVADATTGIEAIDSSVTQLVDTGYMHNHARMWTAMLACNVANAHWFSMSRWMFYHLLDGDLASNTLSWQWVSGTSIQKKYVADQKLINGCSDTQQVGTFLDMPRELISMQKVPAQLVSHEPFSYTMQYPESSTIQSLSKKNVFLYHPWNIDPLWRTDEEGERIFVIEPRLFDRFPVSPKVLDFMLKLLQTHIPGAKIYVGNVETLPDVQEATVFSKSHPATTHFPGTTDAPEELFPQVQGYYQSFFKFWEACQKQS